MLCLAELMWNSVLSVFAASLQSLCCIQLESLHAQLSFFFGSSCHVDDGCCRDVGMPHLRIAMHLCLWMEYAAQPEKLFILMHVDNNTPDLP